MDMVKKTLEHREKAEFIAIIQHIVRQELELQGSAEYSRRRYKAFLAALEQVDR